MKPLEPTGEDTQEIKKPELTLIARQAIIEEALAYLKKLEDSTRGGTLLGPLPPIDLVGNLAKIGITVKNSELYSALVAHKDAWAKERAEVVLPDYPSFSDATNLKELLDRIEEQGGVVGSTRIHAANKLRNDILNILGLRRLGHQLPFLSPKHEELAQEVLGGLPRSQDLRKIVDHLTKEEAAAPMQKPARDIN